MEKIIEDLTPENCHEEFRLWCTTYPSENFPSAVVQNGVKMTMEPPKGLRANLAGSFALDPIANDDFYTSCDNATEEGAEYDKGWTFRKLCFGLAFFHAIVQVRRVIGGLKIHRHIHPHVHSAQTRGQGRDGACLFYP